MREVHCKEIIEVIRDLCIEGNCSLRCDTVAAFQNALQEEESEIGREVIGQLLRSGAGRADPVLPGYRLRRSLY